MAIFIALSGTAWAAAAIGPKQIKRDAVRAKHIDRGAVKSEHVQQATLTGADVDELKLDEAPLQVAVEKGGCPAVVSGTGAMRRVGPVCIDRYENSVWSQPDGGTQLVSEAQIDAACSQADGDGCKGEIFARSVPGVQPARRITWFQAQQALANSGKRLSTNAEWQMAAAGTPDSAACNVGPGTPLAETGAFSLCASDWGANDMIGNVREWVADWDENPAACVQWPTANSQASCIGRGEGDITNHVPAALARGGGFRSGPDAGPLAVTALLPLIHNDDLGFRGAR